MELAPFAASHPEADILITGVGVHTVIYKLIKAIQLKTYSHILQVGVAGSYSTNMELGKAVIVARDRFLDLGVMENEKFLSVFDMGLANRDSFPFTDGWLENPNVSAYYQQASVVNGATVNMLTDNRKHSESLNTSVSAQIESMEGAGLHWVCLMENISFLQIRGISNFVGERDKSKWKMNKAIESSCLLLNKIYHQLK